MKSLILMPSLAKKSFSFTYCPFSAAPPIHWLSPIIRSQSFPLELSSFSMRSAKFGHGTNSNFIWIPVFAVKSFESSTSAFAGSQAAQHNVIVLVCACSADENTSSAETATALARERSLFMTDTSGVVWLHPATSIQGQHVRDDTMHCRRVGRNVFSFLRFTKHCKGFCRYISCCIAA